MTLPDAERRYVTADGEGVLTPWVMRHLASAPTVIPFAPSTQWDADHTLGRLPRIEIYNVNGVEIWASVTSSTTHVTVNFSEPVGGTLILS